MHDAMITPATAVTPRAPRRSSRPPIVHEKMPPDTEPHTNPREMDNADQPRSSRIGVRNIPTMGPCVGTAANAEKTPAVRTAQP